jgi:hypothetical protein
MGGEASKKPRYVHVSSGSEETDDGDDTDPSPSSIIYPRVPRDPERGDAVIPLKQRRKYSKLHTADELLSMTASVKLSNSNRFREEVSANLRDEIDYINSLLIDAAVNQQKTSYEYRHTEWSSWLKRTLLNSSKDDDVFLQSNTESPSITTTADEFHGKASSRKEDEEERKAPAYMMESKMLTMEAKTSASIGVADNGRLAKQYTILCVIAAKLRSMGYSATVSLPDGPSSDPNYYIYINWTKPQGLPFSDHFFRMHWCPRYCVIMSFAIGMIATSIIVIFLFIATLTFISHQYVHMVYG